MNVVDHLLEFGKYFGDHAFSATALLAKSRRRLFLFQQQTDVSRAVMAAFLNVAVSTISQWERGERHPTGAALKLLHVMKRNGMDALR